MPGTVYQGRAADAAAYWKDGQLLARDGVTVLLHRRGTEWFSGRSSVPAWRERGNILHKGTASEPFARVSGDVVYKGASSETLYRASGDALFVGGTQQIAVRGEGLTPMERLLAALTLG